MGYRITLSILTIMILMTISVGSSYSYYAVSSVQEEPNYLSTTCFNISFEDEDSINLTNTYPMSEYDALHKLKPYKFTVTNTCTTENANRDSIVLVLLNYISEKTELQKYLNFKITSNKGFNQEGSVWALPVINDLLGVEQSENVELTKLIGMASIAPGDSEEFSLYMWITEDACDNNVVVNDEGQTECEVNVMGKTFEGQITVYAYM
ncbi:MAG: hypothetical protein E7163_02495 [Firmicutes bacterium]|nr:hypothetical protein [Bacillota bacterium]